MLAQSVRLQQTGSEARAIARPRNELMPELKLTIFVSSPGDVHDESAWTATMIDRLQREVRNHVRLEAYF
jgi:hypothetical protein